jgi:hypothetical protein
MHLMLKSKRSELLCKLDFAGDGSRLGWILWNLDNGSNKSAYHENPNITFPIVAMPLNHPLQG